MGPWKNRRSICEMLCKKMFRMEKARDFGSLVFCKPMYCILSMYFWGIYKQEKKNQGTTSQMQKDLDSPITRLCRKRREEKRMRIMRGEGGSKSKLPRWPAGEHPQRGLMDQRSWWWPGQMRVQA